jgi:tryptophan synthase beta chain
VPDGTPTEILLDDSEQPTQWYHVVADRPAPPPPPLLPGTHGPVGPEDLAPLFPVALVEHEVSTDRYIDTPGGELGYRLRRPSPLFRAHRQERLVDTPATIFDKYGGLSPAGSHEPNIAVPQAYDDHQEGICRLTTETGAGQCIGCEIRQVAASNRAEPHPRTMMEIDGAAPRHSSPSPVTEYGARSSPPTPTTPAASGSASPRHLPPPGPAPATRSGACSTTCWCRP